MNNGSTRTVDYLRISITDRCNERCLYCMPEGYQKWNQREDLLTYEEILRTVQTCLSLGFKKFRVTGGEPLLRPGVAGFIKSLNSLPGVESVGLSTNGILLASMADDLFAAGLRAVNVSLDAMDPAIYHRICGGKVERVIQGIDQAIAAGVDRVKINAVLMRGINEKEILPLIEFAASRKMPIRFIELMPVSKSEMLTEKNFFPTGEVQQTIRMHTKMVPAKTVPQGHGPAVYYELPEYKIHVGFIGAITNLHFCDHCNKIRLTADGFIRPCLGNHAEVDLKPALRSGSLEDEQLRSTILQTLREKPPEHLFRDNYKPSRVMTAIGG